MMTRPNPSDSSEDLPTIDSVTEARRQRAAQASKSVASTSESSSTASHSDSEGAETAMGSPEDLEEEASQQAAFNPETGEINWDCPCLGGMAHGPCGEQFRAAFSCFVFSEAEPKGMDCIDRFKYVNPTSGI